MGRQIREHRLTQDPVRPGVLAAIGIRLRNKTIRRYSRWGARNYETRRKSARWAAETRTFERFLDRIRPGSVLDCPVGSGRWFPVYRRHGASVFGVDVSKHMIAEAARKIPPGADIRVERCDALDPRQRPSLGHGYDLIVCTRFVYWLRPLELAILLGSFRSTGAPLLLASAKVRLDDKPQAKRAGRAGILRFLDRARAHFYRAVVKRVYEEAALLEIFGENGWNLVEKQHVVTTSSLRYFYYLFARADADSVGPSRARPTPTARQT